MAKMKNYYYFELVSVDINPLGELVDLGTYTSLKKAIHAANVQIHFVNAKTMGSDYYRIVRHDGRVMRKYGYSPNGKRYKVDTSKYPIYRTPIT